MVHSKSIKIGGKNLKLETGKLAKQANGAVLISLEDTLSLCTATAKDEPNPDQDFFPLSVDYREKTASVGKIPGGFFKREGRPSEKEILTARLIDRPIRPMFSEGYFCETQIICNVFSSDGENDADVISAIGASAALLISDIPFEEPISDVRVTRINRELILNPTHSEIEQGDFDIVVAGTEDSIVMVEGESKEISEAEFLEAMKFAHKSIVELCKFQREFAKEISKHKREIPSGEDLSAMIADVKDLYYTDINTLDRTMLSKDERHTKHKELKDKVIKELLEKHPESEIIIETIMHDIQAEDLRAMITKENKRLDGRGTKDIRSISSEVSYLPRTHGSALFTRGETQSLTTVTLGTKSDEQIVEGLKEETKKRFTLHYNFPAFSTGEVRGRPGPGRREIGHGNLAERALKNLIPTEGEFPYTIRLVSDILESNGSSSMASVCAGSLALMDAGVKIKKQVAGIAMGLIKEEEEVVILSDILGTEDHFGDMDFKVAGTSDGITSIQMDIKIKGISFEIIEKALEQAKDGRLHILNTMNETISKARDSISDYAPHLYTMDIPTELIGAVIGPGGKTIRNIISESKSEIDINDDGKVTIASLSKESAAIAREMIETLTQVPEVGKIYDGIVKSVKDFGAFVEIFPGKEGLLHISEIDHRRVNKIQDVIKYGMKVKVKLMAIDEVGKLKLSRKVLLKKDTAKTHPEKKQS
jgi:polyribonucleotide nucleotidyltransferase